jgi:predicted nucleic acid-binding protein
VSVLIDTSVWIAHFRRTNHELVEVITSDKGLVHPMVLGELACGTPPEPRTRTLEDISQLRPASQASWPEIIEFIERDQLYDQGCGLIDVALLASTLLTPNAKLWTLDKRLGELAKRYGVAFAA